MHAKLYLLIYFVMCVCLVYTRQCHFDENAITVINQQKDKTERPKRVLTTSKKSNHDFARLSEKLRLENREMTLELTAATRTVRKQADTIEKYERFCTALVSELSDVIGEHKRCYDSKCHGFLRRTLCDAIEVRRLSSGDGLVTGDGGGDFADKLLMMSSVPSTQDGCTQTADYGALRQFSSIHVQTNSTGADLSAVSVQTDTLYSQTVGVQTNFDQVESSEMDDSTGRDEYSPDIDIVAELLDKFGHDTRMNTSRYNIKILLGKAQAHGFQKLVYQELAFLHRNLLAQSAKYFKKYTPLIALAKKKYPSLKSNTIQYKYDIVHIFATMDTVLEIKNKELASERNNSTKNQNKFKALLDEQTQQRISAENKILEVKAENVRLALRNK